MNQKDKLYENALNSSVAVATKEKETTTITTNNKKSLKIEIEAPYKLKPMQKFYCGLKSIMDFFIALIALIILSPLFLIVAIAIKIDSKGPVFFKHKRIGKNNKEFTCIKFRSMAVEARPDIAGYEYKDVNSYITKVGNFLRKTSIDELPQLYCMLTGKMSLIGYRPSQRSEEELNTSREEFDMYQVRPGITGWAQIHGRDVLAAHPKEKAKYDAYYLHHFSMWLDIKIFFMTIAKIFKRSDIEEGVIIESRNVEDKAMSEETL